MIYHVTNGEQAKESLELLSKLKIVGLDSETTGLRVHKDKLLSLQLGCHDFQVVIDCQQVDIQIYKEYLESDRLFVGHNLKFDLQWLFLNKIVPQRLYDTYLGEQILWNGYPIRLPVEAYNKSPCNRYKYENNYYKLDMSLKEISKIYLGIDRDKSVRGQIIYKGLTNEVLKYAADDVKYMEELMNKQLQCLKQRGLDKAVGLTNRFLLPVAYTEFCGIKIDKAKWQEKIERDLAQLHKMQSEMEDWIISNLPDSEYVYKELQGDLFTGYKDKPEVKINWNSPKQVIQLFKLLGIDVQSKDKESIDAKSLAPQANKCSFIPLYLKYKEMAKLVGTYGQNVLKQVNEDGRLYTKYNVIGTTTFRVSSGGEDNGIKYVNMLNMPSDAFTRSCFIVEKGNKWISIDYQGQESVIMASISNDKAMIYELMEGEGDLHTLTAKMIYPEIPKDMNAADVKKYYHKERQESKKAEFAVNPINCGTLWKHRVK